MTLEVKAKCLKTLEAASESLTTAVVRAENLMTLVVKAKCLKTLEVASESLTTSVVAENVDNFEDNSRESDDDVGDLYGGDGGSDDSNDRESIQPDDIDNNSREADDNVGDLPGGDGDPGDSDGGRWRSQ